MKKVFSYLLFFTIAFSIHPLYKTYNKIETNEDDFTGITRVSLNLKNSSEEKLGLFRYLLEHTYIIELNSDSNSGNIHFSIQNTAINSNTLDRQFWIKSNEKNFSFELSNVSGQTKTSVASNPYGYTFSQNNMMAINQRTYSAVLPLNNQLIDIFRNSNSLAYRFYIDGNPITITLNKKDLKLLRKLVTLDQ